MERVTKHLRKNQCHDEADVWCDSGYTAGADDVGDPSATTCKACLVALRDAGATAEQRLIELDGRKPPEVFVSVPVDTFRALDHERGIGCEIWDKAMTYKQKVRAHTHASERAMVHGDHAVLKVTPVVVYSHHTTVHPARGE